MKRCTIVVAGLLLVSFGKSNTLADTLHVPGFYSTIEAAITAATDGDVIQIAAGNYQENTLNFDNKAITIQGTVNSNGTLATTIDAQQGGGVFVLTSGEQSDSKILNLVITGASESGISCMNNSNPTITGCTITGNTTGNLGGGILLWSSHPTISDCTISANTATTGGAISCNGGSSPSVTDTNMVGNTAGNYGGAIACYSSSNPTLTGCTFIGNTAGNLGGGILCDGSSPTITNCNIEDNSATGSASWVCGGGVYCNGGSHPVHSGCTFTGNSPDNVCGNSDWSPFNGVPPNVITLENCTVCGTGEHVRGMIVHKGVTHIHHCSDCVGDMNGDGEVNGADLATLLGAWGPCR